MLNKKVQDFNKLITSFIETKWDGYEVLPVMGSGPLNAPVMVVGINGNMPEEIEKYRSQWDRPFLTEDGRPDYDKFEAYNSVYMRYFLGKIDNKEVAEQLSNEYASQFQAMKDFKIKGEYYDKLGPALFSLLTNETCYEEKGKLKLQQMIRTCIYYSNAIKRPTHNIGKLSPEEWCDEDEKECLRKEIELIEPKFILCFGKDLHEHSNQRFKTLQRHCGSNDVKRLPQHYMDGKDGHIIFMYHFSRLPFWNRYNHNSEQLTKEIIEHVSIFQELEDFWERKQFDY